MKALYRVAAGLLALFACLSSNMAMAADAQTLPKNFTMPLAGGEIFAVGVPQASGGYSNQAITLDQALARGASVKRILNSAQRGITPITQVMASPPTIAAGTINAASTVPPLNALGSESYRANAPQVKSLGGPLAVQAAGFRVQSRTNSLTLGQRTGANGTGMATITPAPIVGIVFGVSSGSLGYIVYVTDLVTGVRARVQAADLTLPATGIYEVKFTFGDGTDSATNVRPRLIELYTTNGSAVLYGFNVDTSKYQCQYPNATEAKWALDWDSWGEGTGNGATNQARLAQPAYLGEALGVTNLTSVSLGSTGYLATNGGAALNVLDRLNAGDLDYARIGTMDGVFIPTSTNDSTVTNGFTPAQLQAQVPLVLQRTRQAQPYAIIVVAGPQYTTSNPTSQAWYDATSAGVAAYIASSGDQNVVYVDNSATGQNWLNAAIDTIIFTGVNQHPNDLGMPYWGHIAGNGIIGAIKAKYGPISALMPRDVPHAVNDNADEKLAA